MAEGPDTFSIGNGALVDPLAELDGDVLQSAPTGVERIDFSLAGASAEPIDLPPGAPSDVSSTSGADVADRVLASILAPSSTG